VSAVKVEKITPAEWAKYSGHAHLIAFGKTLPPGSERIDFALLAVHGEQAMGYVTCREQDAETVYWQFGGAFPGTKDTIRTFQGYRAFVDACRGYKRITTLIENTNTVMLKMAMAVGFRVVGVRAYKGSILLEHLLEFKGG
jgi:hypothetical protein